MSSVPLPVDESARLEALRALELWDTNPEERFDRLTRLATRVLGVGHACINLVGEDRVFSKSHEGPAMNTPRDLSFCAQVILGPEALVVPDAREDDRFKNHPQVTGTPQIRFYLGVAICAPDGSRVGTFCVTDRAPRIPSEEDLAALGDFATMAQGELNVVELNPDYRAEEAEQEKLRLSEERLRDIADAPGTFIWETTLEGKTSYVSDRVGEVLGFSPEEMVERGFFEQILADDLAMAAAKFSYAVKKNQRFSDLEFRYVTQSGRTLWLAVRGAPRLDAEGKIIGYRGLAEEMTDRRLKQEELIAARETAERAALSQAEFLGRVSENIREPLNTLMGLTGQLLGNKLNPEPRRQAEKIRETADQLLGMATDLSDFARIESGLLQFENHPFDLQVLVEDAVQSIAAPAAEKGLEVHWHIAADLPPGFSGDEARLRQILVNLLSHAVATTVSGDISLSAGRAETEGGDHFILFSIWDTGNGLSPEQIDQLFDATNGDGADELGLSISRSLTELMGGRIWAESEESKGTGFHVAVPLQEALTPDPFAPNPNLRGKTLLIAVKHSGLRFMLEAFAQSWGMQAVLAASVDELLQQVRAASTLHTLWIDEALASSRDLLKEIQRHRAAAQVPAILIRPQVEHPGKNLPEGFAGAVSKPVPYRAAHQLFSSLLGGTEAPSATAGPRRDAGFARRRPMRLLVAEDHLPTQKALVGLLVQLGYRPDTAQNGREVLEAVERQAYDVVLMDLAMPEMDGVEAADQIRQRLEISRRPKIIGMAVAGAESDRAAAKDSGFDGHLAKPVRIEGLEPELIRISDQVGQVVDATVLARFLEMTGSTPESMHELADIFSEQTPHALDQLRGSVEARRPQEISRAAVELNRNCGNFGAERMQRLCESLQSAGRDGEFALAAEFVDRLQIEFKRVKAFLDAFVATPSAA